MNRTEVLNKIEEYKTLSLVQIGLNKLNIVDFAFLGENPDDIKELEDLPETTLHHIRLELITLYFNMKREKVDIEQEVSNLLMRASNNVRCTLENISKYDSMDDYWIDFDYCVPLNERYGMMIFGE